VHYPRAAATLQRRLEYGHAFHAAHPREGICIMAKPSKTRPEKKRICNLVPTPEDSTKTDWQFADALDAGVLGA
jgi:hypothetical protein